MRESYIKNKVCKIFNIGGKKVIKDIEKNHQIGRYINRMNAVIQESTMELERHLIAHAKQIAKEEFK